MNRFDRAGLRRFRARDAVVAVALWTVPFGHALGTHTWDAAVRLAPKYQIALFNRGRTKFYSGDYAGAAADLSAAAALKPAEPYILLWLYLARARAGQRAG